MKCSVIISTFNRADSLDRCLASFHAVSGDLGGAWELLVVDNACTDPTREVCERHARALPLRCIGEPRPGKSCALNSAIPLARADLLLLTDDDVTITAAWLREMIAAAEAHPEATHFGGPVIPQWDTPPPAWVSENLELLGGVVTYYDRGRKSEVFTRHTKPFFGANLGLRASAMRERGIRFSEELGIIGTQRIGGEEQSVQAQLIATGGAGCYVPDAVVHHWTDSARATESYVRHWFHQFGRLEAKLGEIPLEHAWAGVPRYLVRQFITHSLGYAITRALLPSRRWLTHEARAAQALGSIRELLESNR